MKKCLSAFTIGCFLLACTAMGKPPQAEKSGTVAPPSNKRVLQLLLKNADLPLTRGAHCKSAATAPDDATLGDYFAGVWQHQTNVKAKNWLAISCEPVLRKERPHWRCDVSTHSNEDKAYWGYGVRLYVDAKTEKVDRTEFMCIGA